MIKHIFELDRQAQEYAAMELATVNTGGVAEFNRLYRNKFAELIVKECVIQCEREWIRHGTDSIHNQAIHGCINSIKQHFGVE